MLLRKITSFGDPRLFAIARVAEHLSHSKQPLVPERMFIAGAGGENGKPGAENGLVGLLVSLLQALTQIQEQTLSFACKLIAVTVTLLLSMNWVGAELYNYTLLIFEQLASVGR